MKKLLIAVLSLALLLSACTTQKVPEEKTYRIGITQIAEHPALDAVREGFVEELEALGVKIEVDYRNAQGDLSTSTSIAETLVQSTDLVLAISTTSAQGVKAAAPKVPALFSAVTDPVESELVDAYEAPGGMISGTSDKTPVGKQLALLQQVLPEVKKVGILYNTSEVNSEIQIRWAKEEAAKLGMEIVEVGVTNVNEIPQALDNLMQRTDALYIITDNLIASSVELVIQKANEKGVVTLGSERGMVETGLLLTHSIDYKELGRQTARMAERILVQGADVASMPVEYLENTQLIINKNTMETLQIEIPQDILAEAELVERTE